MSQSVTLVKATGALTATANFASNDTVLIGNVTYKFEATTGAANDINIGTDLEESLDFLTLAINGTGVGDGTDYHAGTVTIPEMLSSNTATVLTLTARFGGLWGNGFHFAEGVDGGASFSITTAMSSGLGDISGASGWAASLINDNQLNAEVISEVNDLLETNL